MEYESGESHLWKDSAYYDEVDKRQGQRNIGDGFIRAEFINARHFEIQISSTRTHTNCTNQHLLLSVHKLYL